MGVGDVVDDQHSTCALVVDFTQGFVAFLAGSVPESDFYVLIAHLYDFGEKLYSDGGLLTLVEFVPNVACGDVGFAGSGGADDDDFKHFIVVLHCVAVIG